MVSSCLFDDSLLRLCCPDQGIGFEWVLGVVQWMVCAVTLKLITHFIYFIIKGCKKPNPCTSGKQDFSCTLGVIHCLNINGQLLASNIWLLSSIFGKGKQIICVVVAAQMWEKSLYHYIHRETLHRGKCKTWEQEYWNCTFLSFAFQVSFKSNGYIWTVHSAEWKKK